MEERIGAHFNRERDSCAFTLWAPVLETVSLKLLTPSERSVSMERDGQGYWRADVPQVAPGTQYCFRLDNERDRPDPASFYQPRGVHGPSQVVDHGAFAWNDHDWKGIPLSDMIMYELHAGTFTQQGTFDAVIPRLDDLRDLGINAIEIMPVAQFPGDRNWGYDGVYPFAVQNSYGGPDGLMRLVNACHRKGLSVILDVVYNHLGPEGNYLWDFGPYFTDRYRTPWGQAINYDGPHSNGVRNYFIENALCWFRFYHIDALRLDAIHGIFDMGAHPVLQEMAERVDEFSRSQGRIFHLIAESDLNDARVVRPRTAGGYGLDAAWCDDFHHALRAVLTGERSGYYSDFGELKQVAKSLTEGHVYSGQYSRFRLRNHGNSSKDIPAGRFVVFCQNHDQIGNRMMGDRLSTLLSFEALKLAAGMVLLSPYIPLLFMGEEYGERSPFLYFVSHSDQNLIDAVREGRKKEFRSFMWTDEPPDPQGEDTFMKSKLQWDTRHTGSHRTLLTLYRELIRLRKDAPALSRPDKEAQDVHCSEGQRLITVRRWIGGSEAWMIFHFGKEDRTLKAEMPPGQWHSALDSAEEQWGGPGTLLPASISGIQEITIRAESFALFIKENN
ncbi:MAG: malto-oligosyltrehalose trehalohydrolase [Nitrospiraceae bacterium]|nr:MAG: malto-oligosyltrehalose trehalohydrolase [Nitrospiraceae bacterium]